jgi:chorismate mutase
VPLIRPALRVGNTEPTDDLRNALERLAEARASLAQAEASFAAYCRELAAFASDYGLHVGDACEELDRLTAQIEALLAQRMKQPKSRRPTIAGSAPATRPTTSSVTTLARSLRDLYRIAARRFHPDLAGDPADKDWRAAMMREVNAAFASGDSAALQLLLDQPAMTHPIPMSRLAEIEREIAQILARISDLHAAREQMAASDIGQLHAQATAEGRDPIAFLRRLAAAVRTEILEKRALLAQLTSVEPRS